jgi:hypothetical protein
MPRICEPDFELARDVFLFMSDAPSPSETYFGMNVARLHFPLLSRLLSGDPIFGEKQN